MDKNLDKLLTASKLKNWLACNYTTINEINKKELKKKESSITEEIRKKRGASWNYRHLSRARSTNNHHKHDYK